MILTFPLYSLPIEVERSLLILFRSSESSWISWLAIDEQVALGMAKNKLDHIQASRADGLILICPFCDIMYESNQKKIEKVAGKEYKLPILFYPQLLGLAMGMEPEELGMKMNRVKPTELLKKMSRRPG